MTNCMCLALSGLITSRTFQDIMGLPGIGGHCGMCDRQWERCSVCDKVYPPESEDKSCCRTVLDDIMDAID
jgi:hypothetical protein